MGCLVDVMVVGTESRCLKKLNVIVLKPAGYQKPAIDSLILKSFPPFFDSWESTAEWREHICGFLF